MRKRILTLLGSALLATATVQFAAASEHKGRKVHRTPAPVSEQFRNSNAAWPSQTARPDWSRYSGGYSAPAGR
jgi:hypothetical protein